MLEEGAPTQEEPVIETWGDTSRDVSQSQTYKASVDRIGESLVELETGHTHYCQLSGHFKPWTDALPVSL